MHPFSLFSKMAALGNGEALILEAQDTNGTLAICRRALAASRYRGALTGRRFTTAQGVAVINGKPVYVARIMRIS